MKNLKRVISWALGLLSIFMVISGLSSYAYTSGSVQGSEFQMQITLVNQLSLVMLWLALFALRSLMPMALTASEATGPQGQ